MYRVCKRVVPMPAVPIDVIAELVRQTLPAFPEVVGAYLFGSVLDKEPIVGDIDVGLVVRPMKERDAERLESDVECALGEVDGTPFDVTVLDQRATAFTMKVLRQGLLIYEADTDAVTDFIERVSLIWRDVGPRYELARREVLEEVRPHGG